MPIKSDNKVLTYSKFNSGVKYSSSFKIAIILTFFILFYSYLHVFSFNVQSIWPSVISIGITFLIDLFIFFEIAEKRLYNIQEMCLLTIFAFMSIISCLINTSGVQRMLILNMVLLCVCLFVREPLKFSEVQKLFWLFFAVVSIILLITSTGNEEGEASNKINPNTGGFLLAVLFCASAVISLRRKFFSNKFPYIIVCVISLLLQFVFRSRTAMGGAILFTLMMFLGGKKSCKSRSVFWLILILSILGLIFAYVYSRVLFPVIGYGKIIIFGKDIFSGRQNVWDFTFESIMSHPWFGVGSHLNEELVNEGYHDWFMNAHNQPLGIWAACGFFIFAIFYIALSYFLSLLYKKDGVYRFNRLPIYFMFVITIMSYFEIYFMSLFNVIPILLSFLIIMSCFIVPNQKKNNLG